MFKYTLEECELVSLLEKHHTLEEISQFYQRDTSVISRRLNEIYKKHQLLQKINGRWALTEEGRELCRWAKKAANEQQLLKHRTSRIRIATTSEFSTKFLVPNISKILPQYYVDIITSDGHSEELLIDGKVDIAIDCGVPTHPDIRYKKAVKERMVIASAKKCKLASDKYLHFDRTNIKELQLILEMPLNPLYTFNDLGSLRCAIQNSLGFSLIPFYTIRNDSLYIHPIEIQDQMHFGIWWRKDFKQSEIIKTFYNFLTSQSLS